MQTDTSLLPKVKDYVSRFITENVPEEYAYHDLKHTNHVVEGVKAIGAGLGLSETEMEIVQLAAWFHDTGYDKGSVDHEERGSEYARQYLHQQGYPADQIEEVVKCIMATKVPNHPTSILEKVICDADFSHLGRELYWDRCGKVRQELAQTKNLLMSEQEWTEFELRFMTSHRYFTDVASELYDSLKAKHIKQLRKQRERLHPEPPAADPSIAAAPQTPALPLKKKKKKKKKNIPSDSSEVQLKALNLGRGVETMYRTTYRTHINLSSIADNKANIMLSINAIIISITLSTLIPRFDTNPKLILPTIVLLTVCLLAVIFATLSTRPKITEGIFTREDIRNKKSNLLFFGNFYNMDLDDFHWGMMEMIKDSDFLYSSMTRDLYFLGIVLAKKYRYLRICYGIFMYGLIVAVVVFAVAFLI